MIKRSFGIVFSFASFCNLACISGETPQNAPCSSAGLCLPGFQCVDNLCVACEGDACQGTGGHGIGKEGGPVCEVNADDVCLRIPADALEGVVSITIEKLNRAVVFEGLVTLSPVYQLGPADTVFKTPATIEIPISSFVTPSAIGVYRAVSEQGPWMRLTGDSVPITAIGETRELALFVAGHPPRPDGGN